MAVVDNSRFNIVLNSDDFKNYLNKAAGNVLRYTGIPAGVMFASFIYTDQNMSGAEFHWYHVLYRILPAMLLVFSGIAAILRRFQNHYSLVWAMSLVLALCGQALSVSIFNDPAPPAYGYAVALIASATLVFYPLYWYFLIIFLSGLIYFLVLLDYSINYPQRAHPLMIMVGATMFFIPFMSTLLWRQRYHLWQHKMLTEKQNDILQKYARQIDKELSLAARVQNSLLPRLPGGDSDLFLDFRYIPAEHLAGDMVHVIPVNTRQTLLFISDVSGHGIASALFSMMLKIESLNKQFDIIPDSGSLLSNLNTTLYPGVEGHFATGAVCMVDSESGIIEIASAGHHPVIIINLKTLEDRKIKAKGIPLGVAPDQKYSSITETITHEEILFLYSDGCFDLHEDIDFDESVFIELLKESCRMASESAILDFLFAKLKIIMGEKSFMDDVSIIIARLKNPVMKDQ